MNDNMKKEIQSSAFERLLEHLKERKDVQNLDLMNLAGFCRNCFLNGTEKKQTKKELLFQILKLESMYMECPILNGKTNTKNKLFYFSLSLGIRLMKLQGSNLESS